MNKLAQEGVICKMCGTILPQPAGKPTACDPCEEKLVASAAGVEAGDEVMDLQNLITGPYLTAACVMISEQIIHRDPKLRPETKEAFVEEAALLMRYHAPIAYSFFFQTYGGEAPLPSGTIDIMLDLIWKNPLTADYLGGKNNGIILPGQF